MHSLFLTLITFLFILFFCLERREPSHPTLCVLVIFGQCLNKIEQFLVDLLKLK